VNHLYSCPHERSVLIDAEALDRREYHNCRHPDHVGLLLWCLSSDIEGRVPSHSGNYRDDVRKGNVRDLRSTKVLRMLTGKNMSLANNILMAQPKWANAVSALYSPWTRGGKFFGSKAWSVDMKYCQGLIASCHTISYPGACAEEQTARTNLVLPLYVNQKIVEGGFGVDGKERVEMKVAWEFRRAEEEIKKTIEGTTYRVAEATMQIQLVA